MRQFDREFLRKRFPDMEPVEQIPSMTMINGIGFMPVGERDRDSMTDTYVTTVFFCFIYLPLFGFGSYRVADASPPETHLLGRFHTESWHFYGRVPMSTFCKIYNVAVLCAIASLFLFCIFNV